MMQEYIRRRSLDESIDSIGRDIYKHVCDSIEKIGDGARSQNVVNSLSIRQVCR